MMRRAFASRCPRSGLIARRYFRSYRAVTLHREVRRYWEVWPYMGAQPRGYSEWS